jgi:ABC-type Zn uptake system ZnuABC Zn-binding protein ZnuA
LLAPGEDPHSFQPLPSDARNVAEADVIFAFGLGLEPWLADLYEGSGSSALLVEVSQGVELLTSAEGEAHEGEGDAADGERAPVDPHIWFDVLRAAASVERIRDALITADPDGAATYRSNAEAYLAELAEIDRWIVEQVASLPLESRRLVTAHDTFRYFADRYGFVVVGSLLPSSTESATPSAQDILRLAEAIRAQGVAAVFAENVTQGSLLEQVAEEAGVRVVGPLYTDALGPPGSPGDTYIGMMRYNVQLVVEALRP